MVPLLLTGGSTHPVSRPERPGEAEPVALLVDLVAPVRNHAHNRMGTALLKGQTPTLQEFNELADAASPDSPVARRFELDAERFVRGDRSGAAARKAPLTSWRDNHERFAAVATGEAPAGGRAADFRRYRRAGRGRPGGRRGDRERACAGRRLARTRKRAPRRPSSGRKGLAKHRPGGHYATATSRPA